MDELVFRLTLSGFNSNMKHLLLSVCILSSLLSYGQKKCDCVLKDDYIKHRDYDSLRIYRDVDLLKESRRFLQSKSASCNAYGYHLKAVQAIETADYEHAIIYLDREKVLLDSLRCKQLNYLESYVGYGDLLLRIGNYDGAVTNYSKALALLKQVDNKSLQSRVLLSLSNALSKLGNEDKARGYLALAHPLVKILPDGPGKVESLYNLSARYYHQYQITSNAALLDSAQHAAFFGIRLAKSIGYKTAFIRGYNLLEDKEYHEKNYRQALVYLDSALYFTVPAVHPFERNGIYADMADIYLELKQYDKAYLCADSSLSNAVLLNNPYKVKNALELLYNCSKLNGEYERALTVYEDLSLMRDSVLKLESNKAFSDLEEKYHRVRKEKDESQYVQDKRLLEQQRQIGNLRSKLFTIGLVITALLAFYIFIVFRQKNMRSKQKRLEVEQRLHRARINPDFIYKALSNLQGIAANESGNSDMVRKLASFGKLVKQSLESSHDDFLTLDKEIEFLTYYMELQRDRLNNSFSYRFEVDDQIDQSDVCLPTMILQPFIENTIERGFVNLGHPGTILLSFKLHGDNELHIKIFDNGKGLKAAASGRASQIINDRLYLLNKMNKDSASYLIREPDSGGVCVEIFLPLITREMAESRKRDV